MDGLAGQDMMIGYDGGFARSGLDIEFVGIDGHSVASMPGEATGVSLDGLPEQGRGGEGIFTQ